MQNNKGTLKIKVATIEIRGYANNTSIIDLLLESGYDIESTTILNETQHNVGEHLTVYSVDRRGK